MKCDTTSHSTFFRTCTTSTHDTYVLSKNLHDAAHEKIVVNLTNNKSIVNMAKVITAFSGYRTVHGFCFEVKYLL